ncbi:hypothetical protein HAX54_018106, partial [Datura stramonium]|nr:hypothetical protein [Datura stramonium]
LKEWSKVKMRFISSMMRRRVLRKITVWVPIQVIKKQVKALRDRDMGIRVGTMSMQLTRK